MNTQMVLPRLTNLLIVLTLSLSLAACGTFEIGVERTSSPTSNAPATVMPSSTPARSSPPNWQLVYRLAAEGQLWLATSDGSQARLAAELPDTAAGRVLGPRYLAYVLDTRLYVLDPATGEARQVLDFAERGMEQGLDVALCWSRGGESLAYAAAYESSDGSRRVELGLVNGYEQRTITTIEARPAGPTPTAPPMPPAPPEPGFANLHLLGYDILADLLIAVPVGGQEHYSGIWSVSARNGDRVKTIPLYDIGQIAALALSPDATRLAVARAGSDTPPYTPPSRLDLYSIAGESTVPETYNLPFRGYAVDLRWSPDGESLAFLANIGGPGLEVSPTAALWVMNVSDHSFRQVLALESPEARLIGWAPEPAGHVLLAWLEGFSRQEHYQLVDVATGTVADLPLPSTADVLGWVKLTEAQETPALSDLSPGLVFGTGTGLWQVEEDGQPRQILNRSDVVLSPDGTQAIYTTPDSDLWLIDLTTGEKRNLTSTPDRMECCPQWWPARPDTIIFGSWPQDADPGPSTGFLTIIEADGSDYRVLSESLSNAPPAPAPDGQTIAYDQGGTAYLYRQDTSPVPFDPAAYGLPVHRIGSPAWSPDGRRLAWIVGGDFGQGWRIGLGVFDLEARTARLLHPFEPRGVGGWPGAAVWSPDGEWLAYAIWPAADPNEEGICVFRANGEEEHCLGTGGGPVWSPDGRQLAFRRDSALWLAEAGTWDLLPVVDDAWPVAWLK